MISKANNLTDMELRNSEEMIDVSLSGSYENKDITINRSLTDDFHGSNSSPESTM